MGALTSDTAQPRGRRTAAVAALLFFFAPAIAYAVGARPQQIENRPLASFPSVSRGWSFLDGVTGWATDHLPWRDQAVRADTAVAQNIFGELPAFGDASAAAGSGSAGVPGSLPSPPPSPQHGTGAGDTRSVVYPQVIQGKDGWLYYGSDVSIACEPPLALDDLLARLRRLQQAVTSSGRRFVLVVAPDKSTIVPQHLPDTYVGQECAAARKGAFWSRLTSGEIPGFIDLRPLLEQDARAQGQPPYRPLDTHWTPRGGGVFAEALARTLQPSLLEGTSLVDAGMVTQGSDLAGLLGQSRSEQLELWQVRRTGVTAGYSSVAPVSNSVASYSNTTTGATLYQPSTLLLGDSFTEAAQSEVLPFFAHISVLRNTVPLADTHAAADAMRGAHTVVLEIVERAAAGGDMPILSDASLSAIGAAMAGSPAP